MAEAAHLLELLSTSELPREKPDIWHDAPNTSAGRLIWRQSGWDVSEEMINWLKMTHGVEWGGGALDTPRPDWVVSNNAYWWCLCCEAQMPSISSVHAHAASDCHWQRRQAMDQ